MKNTIKICTFNIRVECDAPPLSRKDREPHIFSLIADEKPDLIGFQEASDGWAGSIRENLSGEYVIEGCGRETDRRGESTPIAIRKGILDIIDVRNFWLSQTPSVPGSRYGLDQSGCPRMVTAVRLRHTKSGRIFCMYNTHLDHVGETARLLGAMQIIQDISMTGEPFILTGDMNAEPGSPEIDLLSGFSGSHDCTKYLKGTFHYWGKLDPGSKIDYIFTDLRCDEKKSYVIRKEPVNGTYISDHWPVFSFIEIE